MGLSRKAFEASGFGNIHPGEDPDLSIRLWNLGFETRLIPDAYVYHKRRIDWDKFSVQVNKFGSKAGQYLTVGPKQCLLFLLPSVFIIGLFVLSSNALFNFDLPLTTVFCLLFLLF
jgi:hypothetical protein